MDEIIIDNRANIEFFFICKQTDTIKLTSEEISGVDAKGAVPDPALRVVSQLAHQRPVARVPHLRRTVARCRHQHPSHVTETFISSDVLSVCPSNDFKPIIFCRNAID